MLTGRILSFFMLASVFLQVCLLTEVRSRAAALQPRRMAAVDLVQKLLTGQRR